MKNNYSIPSQGCTASSKTSTPCMYEFRLFQVADYLKTDLCVDLNGLNAASEAFEITRLT